jgi:two-component system, OmpR family, sensor kinase
VSRLPIRLRVTIAFAAGMALVLLAVGLLIYGRYKDELTSSLDQTLRSRANDVTTLLHESDSFNDILPTARSGSAPDRFGQILTPSGRVLDSSAPQRGRSALPPAELRQAASKPVYLETAHVPGLEGSARLRGTPVLVHHRHLIVVTGESLQQRDDALSTLRTLLLIGGPAALLLALLVGYAAVAAALRPVEAIRREASEISAADGTRRLPVPPANDELRRLGETLNEMLARLDAALERERSFVDDASHELRTPLAMHRAELEMALRYAASKEELRAAIASAIEEVARLSQLAEDLLVLARSDQGQLATKVERVPVVPLLESVRERFAPRAEAANRALTVDAAGNRDLHADRLRLEQALGNMIDNALRHGGGPIRIWARHDDSTTELHVTDGGEGFPPEFLGSAFERFSRPDGARAGTGSGLGLSIVEAIATAHGGAAGAVNGDGGPDVWIALPLCRD